MKPTLNVYDASQTRDLSKLAPAKESAMTIDTNEFMELMSRFHAADGPEWDECYKKIVSHIDAVRATPSPAPIQQTQQNSCIPPSRAEPAMQHIGYFNTRFGTFFALAQLAHTDRNTELLSSGEIVKAYASSFRQEAEGVAPAAIVGSSGAAEDQAFYRFWYGHMFDDQMTGALRNADHATAKYVWNAATRSRAEGGNTKPSGNSLAPTVKADQ